MLSPTPPQLRSNAKDRAILLRCRAGGKSSWGAGRLQGSRDLLGRCGDEALEIVLGDEHAPGLRALVGRDDSAPFEHVDQPARAGVADAKPALQQRDAGGLGGDHDLDRLVEQRVLVRVVIALVGVGIVCDDLWLLKVALVDDTTRLAD